MSFRQYQINCQSNKEVVKACSFTLFCGAAVLILLIVSTAYGAIDDVCIVFYLSWFICIEKAIHSLNLLVFSNQQSKTFNLLLHITDMNTKFILESCKSVKNTQLQRTAVPSVYSGDL